MTTMISTRVNHHIFLYIVCPDSQYSIVYEGNNIFMNRLLILSLLAIAFYSFAQDTVFSVLQARSISDTSVSLSWSPIPDAVKYRVYFDEKDLLDTLSPVYYKNSDFLDTEFTEISGLEPWKNYIMEVRWYDIDFVEIWKTYRLHAKTYQKLGAFKLISEPFFSKDNILELQFNKPIQSSGISVELKKKGVKWNYSWIEPKISTDDLRVLRLHLLRWVIEKIPYELHIKNIESLENESIDIDNKTPITVIYDSSIFPDSELLVVEDVPDAVWFSEPVSIDTLPKTWPWIVMLVLFSAMWVLFLRKYKYFIS